MTRQIVLVERRSSSYAYLALEIVVAGEEEASRDGRRNGGDAAEDRIVLEEKG